MKERHFELTPKNISFYIFGFLTIGLGVNVMLRSQIGAGAWDATNFNLNILLQSFGVNATIGTTSMIVGLFLFLWVILYRREWKMMLVLIPIFTVFLVIDFWDLIVLNNFHPTDSNLRLFLFGSGLLLIPFGLACVIHSNFPATVYDEFSIMMHDILKLKSFGTTRLLFELLGVFLAFVFIIIARQFMSQTMLNETPLLGTINFGTIVMAVTLGPILNSILALLQTIDEKGYKAIIIIIRNSFKQGFTVLKSELKLSRVIKYLLGMVFIAVGVVFMLRSNFGNSSWDTLHYSLSALVDITIGSATIYVALTFTLMVIILNKDIKFILMAIPIVIVGPLIDLFDLRVFTWLEPETLLLQIPIYIIGLSLLPLGGALLLISSYPAGVFDEFNLALKRLLKMKSLVPIRVIMELTAVLTALVLGLIAGVGIGKIGIGTLIFSLTVGFYLKTYLKLFERIGLSEHKQND
jgi:uncharacterized membrane protein YczE